MHEESRGRGLEEAARKLRGLALLGLLLLGGCSVADCPRAQDEADGRAGWCDPQRQELDCDDGYDGDRDGLFDCEDIDCEDSFACHREYLEREGEEEVRLLHEESGDWMLSYEVALERMLPTPANDFLLREGALRVHLELTAREGDPGQGGVEGRLSGAGREDRLLSFDPWEDGATASAVLELPLDHEGLESCLLGEEERCTQRGWLELSLVAGGAVLVEATPVVEVLGRWRMLHASLRTTRP